MGLFYSTAAPVDAADRAERAAADKKSLAEQTGPLTAKAPEYSSRLEVAMDQIEKIVYESAEYKGRVSPAEIIRGRDSCIGALSRAVANGQLTEDLALQVYKEACAAEADALMARPTTAAALVNTRIKSIIPKQAFGDTWSWQGAIERGLGRGAVPRGMDGIAIDTLGAEVLEPGDEITGFEERHQIFHIESLAGKARQVKLSSLKNFKPRGVEMDAAGIERWDRHFILKRSSEFGGKDS